MDSLTRWLVFLLPLSFLTGLSLNTPPTQLIKQRTSPTVYFLTNDHQRLMFPTEDIFYSWYPPNTKSNIRIVSAAEMEKYPISGSVYYRPGVKMVKLANDSRVYAVSRAGVLRWIKTEAIAIQLYGTNWHQRVVDLPEELFRTYSIEKPIETLSDFDPAKEQMATVTIDQNRRYMRWLNKDQKRRAEQLTSIFENGTTAFNYAYVENLDDGRGYTSGRVGFTTATGDALLVVEEYALRKPNNVLVSYLPRLRVLAEQESDSVRGLEKYPQRWVEAAKDFTFRQVQDEVMDDLYYRPAMKRADALGLRTVLSRAIIYDTIIQHGDWEGGPDSLPALISRTNEKMRGSPLTGRNETEWIKSFLAVRKADLLYPSDQATRDVWAKSAGRCDVLLKLVEQKNFDLNGPIIVNTAGYEGKIF